MKTLVDTSVWSLALRRDAPAALPEIEHLRHLLASGDAVGTGLILQELLQGFARPPAAVEIVRRFASIPFVSPDRTDHVHAADLRNRCRRKGVQVGTIDALLAQLCIRFELVMLSTDHDFHNMADVVPLSVWTG